MPGYSLGRNTSTMELKLPSDNTCLVRKPDPVAMLSLGLLDDFDALTSIAALNIQQAESPTGDADMKATLETAKEIMANKEALEKGLRMMDSVVEWVVVEPSVLRPIVRDKAGNPALDDRGQEIPLQPNERLTQQLYTDEVDADDKAFLLQWAVGGTKDLEQFRKEQAGVVDALAADPGVQVPALGDLTSR